MIQKAHLDWITKNVSADCYGKCAETTLAMQQEFPELARVRGHYYDTAWGERAHWWLVAEDGTIVDPTSAQFPTKGTRVYVEWDETQPEPTGMCPNCGGYCYSWETCCSEKCSLEYMLFCIRSVL